MVFHGAAVPTESESTSRFHHSNLPRDLCWGRSRSAVTVPIFHLLAQITSAPRAVAMKKGGNATFEVTRLYENNF